MTYMPLAYIAKAEFDARATTRARELSHVAFLTVAAERFVDLGRAGVKGEQI